MKEDVKKKLSDYQDRLKDDVRAAGMFRDKLLLTVATGGIAFSCTFVGLIGFGKIERLKYWWVIAIVFWSLSFIPYYLSFCFLSMRCRKMDVLIRDGRYIDGYRLSSKRSGIFWCNILHALFVCAGLISFLSFVVRTVSPTVGTVTPPLCTVRRMQVDMMGQRGSCIEQYSLTNRHRANGALAVDNARDKAHIDFLKSRIDVILWAFGLFSAFIGVYGSVNLYKASQVRSKIKEIAECGEKALQVAKHMKTESEDFNLRHMNYNARIFNSLGRVFGFLADAFTLNGSTLADWSINSRSVLLQTEILYYEQAIHYDMEANLADDLFVPVHNLASLSKRLFSKEFSKERHKLKEEYLANHSWRYSPNEIEQKLKCSNRNVAEIMSAVAGYRKIIDFFS